MASLSGTEPTCATAAPGGIGRPDDGAVTEALHRLRIATPNRRRSGDALRSLASHRGPTTRQRRIETNHPATRPVLATLSVAAGLLVTDYSIVSVALPSIRRDLGFSDVGVQWVITGFTLPFGGLLLLGGRAADLYGRRRMLVAGLLVFGVGLLVAAVAWERWVLVGARAVQGFGAAFTAPAVLALVTTLHPAGPARRRAVGVYGAVLAGGFAVGVTAGGAVTALVGWRAVFLVQLPVLAAVLATTWARVPDEPVPRGGRLPASTAVLLTAAIVALTYGLSEIGRAGWTSPPVLASLALAALFGAATRLVERREECPLVPGCVWKGTHLRSAAYFAAVSGAAAGGVVLLYTLYLRDAAGYGVIDAAAALLPLGVAAGLAGLVSARVAGRLGEMRTLAASLALQAAGTGMLALGAGAGRAAVGATGGALIGAGHVGAIASTATIGIERVPKPSHGSASGVLNTALEVGSAIGVALLVTISTLGAGRPAYGAAFAAAAMLLAGAAFAALSTA
jgi:MFS family permease